jgi:hypothetical protein
VTRSAALLLAAVVAACAACSGEADPAQHEAWLSELQELERANAELTNRLTLVAAGDPEVAKLPDGEVVLVVPTAFLRSLITRVFTDVASRLEITLTGIRVHHEQTLKKVVTMGNLVVDVDVNRVYARLEPGEPDVEFGGNRIALTLPVRVVEGSGDATVHLVWEGRNVAGAVCGDLDIQERITGDAIPAEYVLSGAVLLSADGTEIAATPRFPETKLNVRVSPSSESWAAIDRVLESKRGLCGWVLDRVDVKKLVAQQVEEKGFDIKLPLEKIMPFRFPAGLNDSVDVGGKPLALDVRAGSLRIDREAIWAGAHVRVAPGSGG